MACPAINGYHSVATYSWQSDATPIMGEETPLLFCTKKGVYRCCITAGDNISSQQFVVSGSYNNDLGN